MDKIAVIIPCYNEGKTIAKVVTDFRKILPDSVIYVYDNNSTDDTAKKATKAGAIVRHVAQQGKGNVIRRMFREVDAKCYILVDGDATYSAKDAIKMVDKVLNNNVDMVIGDRLSSTYYEENKRLFHNFGNYAVCLAIKHLFKSNISDVMSGYRAFSYQFVKTFPVLSKGFEIETEMGIHALDKNMSIDNMIVEYKDRPKGSFSKLNTYIDGCKIIFTILKFYRIYKPLMFFSIIAVILSLIALGFFLPVFINYLETGLVARFPTLIVCGFTFIVAIQSFFVGLTLQTLVVKNRQDFESRLIEINELRKLREK